MPRPLSPEPMEENSTTPHFSPGGVAWAGKAFVFGILQRFLGEPSGHRLPWARPGLPETKEKRVIHEGPVRRGKAPSSGGCEPRPTTVAPVGSSQGGSWRQRYGLKHSGVKGRHGRLSDHAGRNASERRAGLETDNTEADPPDFRGRPLADREESDAGTDPLPSG